MEKYICYAKGKEQFDYLGGSLGMSEDRALYYYKNVGKHRVYRSGYPTPSSKALFLFKFDTEHAAIELCHEINEFYNDDFKPLYQKLNELERMEGK